MSLLDSRQTDCKVHIGGGGEGGGLFGGSLVKVATLYVRKLEINPYKLGQSRKVN